MAQDVNNVDVIVLCEGVKLCSEKDFIRISAAVKEGKGAVLVAFADCSCEREEGRDAAAACDADDILRISEGIIDKVAFGCISCNLIINSPVIEDIIGNKAVCDALDGNLIFAFPIK